MARNVLFKQLHGLSAPRPVELESPHVLPMTTLNAAWWKKPAFVKCGLVDNWCTAAWKRVRNAARPRNPLNQSSLLMRDVQVWRSTVPSTAAPAWMADAARPCRLGLWRCDSTAKMERRFPRTSWWSSPANAATTARIPVRQRFPSTGCSMIFTNLGTKCHLGWQHKVDKWGNRVPESERRGWGGGDEGDSL